MAREEKKNGVFFNILADGKFHQTVDEGTESAVLREGETKEGEKYSKWEKLFESLSGKIKSVEFFDGNYGKNIIVNMEDEEGEFGISVSTSSNFGEDLMKKLPNIKLLEEVKFAPYSFEDDKGKTKKGITVTQNGEKVQSYYHDYNPGTKAMTLKNGYPEAPVAKKGKTISSDEWKVYFGQARIFMIGKTEELFEIEATVDKEDF